ncbi:hypothetical protein GGI15_004880 [Coemansia interrupta]|uniref:Uncharacterized protein n=1 Tax=Coemansia interrupta TaxID=1126814 RepID=A0A9W8LDT8_9FUNG|nr:hypothetical protein GGI15_004880 [Coemansia interrupta]
MKARIAPTQAADLLDAEGDPTSDPDQQKEIIKRFYSKLFGKGNVSTDAQTELLSHWRARLDPATRDILNQPIWLSEVQGVIRSVPNNKTTARRFVVVTHSPLGVAAGNGPSILGYD